jgi:hypothetical protein
MAKQQLNNAQTQGSILGYTQITSNFVTSTVGSYVDVTGLSVTVNVPAGTRGLKITIFAGSSYCSAAIAANLAVREGSTTLNQSYINASGTAVSMVVMAYVANPTPGTHTYKGSLQLNGAATYTLQSAPAPSGPGVQGQTFILVEAI